MRSFVKLALVAIAVTFAGSTQAVAQSGTRAAGGLSGGGGAGGFSGGGGFSGSGFSGGDFTSGYVRPTRAQRQQQARQRQAQAQRNARLQAERAKRQYKQSLVQLGLPANSSENSRQYAIAFQEAMRDYQALRSNRIAPNRLGALRQPFRLTNKDISHSDRTANWPDALRSDTLGTLVQDLDQTIMGGGVDSRESAREFLSQLQVLNVALNTSAAQGKVNIRDFARSRRFITGLANEIRSSNLVM